MMQYLERMHDACGKLSHAHFSADGQQHRLYNRYRHIHERSVGISFLLVALSKRSDRRLDRAIEAHAAAISSDGYRKWIHLDIFESSACKIEFYRNSSHVENIVG